jgi:hypothetical protein
MLIECHNCPARGAGCGGCFVPALLADDDAELLDARERQALAVLADAGLIPARQAERAS